MEKIQTEKQAGLSGNTIKIWGFLFLMLGAFSQSILQNGLLNMQETNMGILLHDMQNSQGVMMYVTLALLFTAIATCAAPIFTFLLVEEFTHTPNFSKYFERIFSLAIVSEIPYNLMKSAKWIDSSSRNPVFALVLGLVMLYFFARYKEKRIQYILIKIVVILAAFAWVIMFRIEEGIALLILICVFWVMRGQKLYQNFVGAAAAASCSIFSPFFLAAPMGFLVLHFYNGEKDTKNSKIFYFVYPLMMLIFGVASILL